jgi:hypothetical protein
MARDTVTGDLFGHAHGNGAARERLAMEMRSKPALQAAQTRKAAKRIADTTREAHDAVKPRVQELQEKCLAALPFGPPGMTPDECAAAVGEHWISIRPRFTELKDAGSIVYLKINGEIVRRKNAHSGRTAYVYVRAPR